MTSNNEIGPVRPPPPPDPGPPDPGPPDPATAESSDGQTPPAIPNPEGVSPERFPGDPLADPKWRWVGARADDHSPDGKFRRQVAAVARQIVVAYGLGDGAAAGQAAGAAIEEPAGAAAGEPAGADSSRRVQARDPGYYDLSTAVPHALVAAGRSLGAHLAVSGSTRTDVVLVAIARTGGGATSHGLLRSLDLPPSTVSSITSRLARAGLVVCRPIPGDRRSRSVELTSAGRRMAEQVAASWRHADSVLLDALSPAERTELYRLLRRADAALTRGLPEPTSK